jgi:ABC-type polysaccharide/polyol phosphate export permease
LLDFLKAVFANKRLLLELTKNDFKQKYVGNMLGIFWAFIQPTAIMLFVPVEKPSAK